MLRFAAVFLILAPSLFAGTIAPGDPLKGITSVSVESCPPCTVKGSGTFEWVFYGASGPGTALFVLTAKSRSLPE